MEQARIIEMWENVKEIDKSKMDGASLASLEIIEGILDDEMMTVNSDLCDELAKKGFTGSDVSPEIALMEYGLMIKKYPTGVFDCIIGVGARGDGQGYGFFANTEITVDEIKDALESDKDNILSFSGIDMTDIDLDNLDQHDALSLIDAINTYNGYLIPSSIPLPLHKVMEYMYR